MNVQYINPFIKACTEVLRTIAAIELDVGAPYLKKSPFSTDNLIIVIGITGEIRGQVVISMPEEVAKNLASKMMMGMPVDELNEMAKSALSELGNMIMGNAATVLFNDGVNVDITPPSLFMGQNLSMTSGEMKTIGIPLNNELGLITLDISIKE